MKAFKSTVLPAFMAALAAHGAVACGSDGEGSGVQGGSNGPSGGTNQPSLGNPNAPNGGFSAPHDGGSIVLTPDQIEDIENAACTGWAGEGENLPAVLQLVVDVSASMNEEAPGSRQSKWEVTRDALRDALEALPGSAAVGVLYYPNLRQVELATEPRPIDACVNVDAAIPIDLLGNQGSSQRRALDRSLDDADTNGYTPTHDAYKYAIENSLQPYQSQANKFMLLITDGSPTMALQCIGMNSGGGGGGLGGGQVADAPTQPIVDEISKASGAGIRTFVIGSPGSEESSSGMGGDKRPWLSKAAEVGGTAAAGCKNEGPNFCHLDMTQEQDFAQALVDGLASIVGQIIDQCTFTVPEAPMGQTLDPEKTTVVIQTSSGSKVVLPDNQGDCSEGWQLSATGQVELCAGSCNEIKGDPSARVQLFFGCSTSQVVPVE